MTRTIAHNIGSGYIEVTARAYSVAEALAFEAAIKAVPVASAFTPDPPPTVARELHPEVEALIERDADSDMGLKAGEAA